MLPRGRLYAVWCLGGILPMLAFCGCERRPEAPKAVQSATDIRDPNEIRAALPELDRRIAANASDAPAYAERGKLRRRLSEYEASEKRWALQRGAWADFRKAHELAGGTWDFPDPFETLARAMRDPQFQAKAPASSGDPTKGSIDALLGAEALASDLEMVPICAQLINRAAQLDPRHSRVRIRQVMIRAQMDGDWRTAAKALTAMSAEDAIKDRAEFWHALGFAQQQSGDFKSAATAYRRALELAPGGESTQVNLATVLDGLGEIEEAKKLFESVGERNPNALFATNNYAASLNSQGRFREAVALLRPVMERNPGFPMGWINLGNSYESLRDYDSAINAYEKLSSLLPREADGPFMIGRAQRLAGRAEEALKSLDHANALNTGRCAAGILMELALALHDLDRDEESDSRFREALRCKPGDPRIAGYFGLSLYERKRYDDAREQLEISFKGKNPDLGEYVMTVHNLAHLELDTGHDDRAIEVARAAYDRHRDVEQFFSEFYAVLVRAHRTDEAARLLEEARRANPTWAAPYWCRADEALDAGRYDDALADFGRAYDCGKNPELRASRALLYWVMGRTDDARREAYAALDESPGHPYASLCVWILERERHDESAASHAIAAALQKSGPATSHGWTRQLLRFAHGDMSNEELLAAARTPGDKCEACFYIGERVRLEHTLAEAVPWYQQCIEQNERDYWEDRLARARLESAKSLDAGQQDAAHEN